MHACPGILLSLLPPSAGMGRGPLGGRPTSSFQLPSGLRSPLWPACQSSGGAASTTRLPLRLLLPLPRPLVAAASFAPIGIVVLVRALAAVLARQAAPIAATSVVEIIERAISTRRLLPLGAKEAEKEKEKERRARARSPRRTKTSEGERGPKTQGRHPWA